jgi:hypothetical protein
MEIDFKIKKGDHYTSSYVFKILLLLYNFIFFRKKELQFDITFGPSCLYKLPEDDINKLFGFSIGHNHMKNSIRFGWRNLYPSKQIEIFAFYHIDGQFKFRKICNVDIGKTYVYNCTIEKKDDHFFYFLNVYDGQNLVGSYKSYLFKIKSKIHFSYNLFPYFGGSYPAPHDMIIKFKI